MGKHSLYARQRIVNLHQLKKNDFRIANEIKEGGNINMSIPVLRTFAVIVYAHLSCASNAHTSLKGLFLLLGL